MRGFLAPVVTGVTVLLLVAVGTFVVGWLTGAGLTFAVALDSWSAVLSTIVGGVLFMCGPLLTGVLFVLPFAIAGTLLGVLEKRRERAR